MPAVEQASATVGQVIYDGLTHEFFGLAARHHQGRQSQALVQRELKNALGARAQRTAVSDPLA